MAFDISAVGGYGAGGKGDLTVGAAQTINSYAQVTAISKKVATLGNVSSSADFVVGASVLIHVANYTGTSNECKARGAWLVATIKSISGNNITFDKKINGVLCGFNISDLQVQAIPLPEYKNVTIKSGKSLTCPKFDNTLGYGGLLAFKVSATLNFDGGHIDLKEKGLPEATHYQKGLPADEINDGSLRRVAGWENHRALQHLTINFPYGACFIIANKISGDKDTRIGNPTDYYKGVQRTRSTTTHDFRGGSSILIAAQTFDNFSPDMLAKLNPDNKNGCGYGRCYIATESVLPNDEGLYAYDRISNPDRLSDTLKIKNFGNGSDNEKTNYKSQINNYASIIGFDSSRKVLTVAKMSTAGFAKFKKEALVMVHVSTPIKKYAQLGKFILAKIVNVSINQITIDTAVPKLWKLADYAVQVLTIPQFSTFTLSQPNAKTPKYENGCGGIFAIAVAETCDLSSGTINLYKKGGGTAYGATGLNYISNAQMAERLPLGEGNGSAFILAKNLIMNTSTRIGATWSGNAVGGLNLNYKGSAVTGTRFNNVYQRFEGGDTVTDSSNGLEPNTSSKVGVKGMTGGGKTAGYEIPSNAQKISGEYAYRGGFGSNAADGACQGSHIFICADKITGFNIAAMSTGGERGTAGESDVKTSLTKGSENGGCGYGGGGTTCVIKASSGAINEYRGGNGGYHGGGGGAHNSSAWASGGGAGGFCFVYCNQYADLNTSGISAD